MGFDLRLGCSEIPPTHSTLHKLTFEAVLALYSVTGLDPCFQPSEGQAHPRVFYYTIILLTISLFLL
jgi:hypothetical protein